MTIWEQVKDRRVGEIWQPYELRDCFVAIAGGVACPGKRPGFAIVAGLRPIQQKDFYEIDLLAEAESSDPYELLSKCQGLMTRYYIDRMEDTRFSWYGDGRNAAAQAIVRKLNDEGRPLGSHRPAWRELSIITASVLNMDEQAMPFMFSQLKQYTTVGRNQLHLHGCKAEYTMRAIRPEEIPGLVFGDYPDIEALGFVVSELRETAARMYEDKLNPPKQQEPYDPMQFV